MSKTLKKTLSLILALTLTFTMGVFAFATDSALPNEPVTKEEAEIIALECLSFKNQTSIVYEDEYDYIPAYKVISTVVLHSNPLDVSTCAV